MSQITLTPPPRFDLHHAVASYGYFLLAPNFWDTKKRVLHRPLRTADGRLVRTTLRQRKDGKLVLTCDRALTRPDQTNFRGQVARMLRFDEDFRGWRGLHPLAKKRRFDRMFRSPTLFEDMVKTITSCNVTWRNTITMNRLMVEHVGDGGFPTPGSLADYGVERLKEHCKVGYRAERITRLARSIVDGSLDLSFFENPRNGSEEVYKRFLSIHGLGPYAAANLCHLVGRYDRLAIDSETYRHFCHHYNVKRPDTPAGLAKLHNRIEKHYGQYQPYAFMAYWFELWEDYQARFGPAWSWDRDTTGTQFTAAVLK